MTAFAVLRTPQSLAVMGSVVRECKKVTTDRQKVPTQRAFNELFRTVQKRFRAITRRLANGSVDSNAWLVACVEVLTAGHENAARLGRQRAGDLVHESLMDQVLARLAMDKEGQFLKNFAGQIEADDRRYRDGEGSIRQDAILNRLTQYTHGIRVTSNSAFVGTSIATDQFDWVMLNDEHCNECPGLAAGSPYTKATLPKLPGQAECRHYCGCVLVRYDGRIGFARPSDPLPDVVPGSTSSPDAYRLAPEDMPDLFAAPDTVGEFFAI